MELFEAEKQVLIVVRVATKGKETANIETLQQCGEHIFRKELVDWTGAFEQLMQKNLLQEKDGVYSLTKQGDLYAKQTRRERANQKFSDILRRSEHSPTYGRFCGRVYGKNLCQLNMLPMNQLEKLLNVLNLTHRNQVLDVGCGIGTITEYISDHTYAHLIGVDVAEGAIERANERTKAKRHRLSYHVGDMDDLHFSANSFDTIIAIDTLYFVDNLEKTFERLQDIVTANGQMGLFFTQRIDAEDPAERLLPEGTRLAQVLKKYHVDFQAWDFTEDEKALWRRCKQVAEELKDAFEMEGNLDIYEARVREAEHVLTFVESDRISRYLYHVLVS